MPMVPIPKIGMDWHGSLHGMHMDAAAARASALGRSTGIVSRRLSRLTSTMKHSALNSDMTRT